MFNVLCPTLAPPVPAIFSTLARYAVTETSYPIELAKYATCVIPHTSRLPEINLAREINIVMQNSWYSYFVLYGH